MKARLPGLLAAAGVLVTCSSEQSNDDAGTTLAAYYVNQCAKIAACSSEYSVSSCFGGFFLHDYWQEEGIIAAQMLPLRQKCLEGAQDCDAVNACLAQVKETMERRVSEPPAGVSCGEVEEVKCDDDKLVWCFKPEYDSPRPIVFDLQYVDKSCNTKGTFPADPEHQSCEPDASSSSASQTCDGPLIRQCVDGETLTWDCREIDPDFRCVAAEDDADLTCGLPLQARQCEDTNYSNNGNAANCEGDVARVCSGGKLFRVDCASFPGATCTESDQREGAASCGTDN
jgi:hypothetical protein